jgi:hypothetical protein
LNSPSARWRSASSRSCASKYQRTAWLYCSPLQLPASAASANGRLAERYPLANLDTAIAIVERLRRAELDARAATVRLWGRCSRPRLALMLLEDLRLIQRMVRRYAPARYAALVAAVLDSEEHAGHISEAAE